MVSHNLKIIFKLIIIAGLVIISSLSLRQLIYSSDSRGDRDKYAEIIMNRDISIIIDKIHHKEYMVNNINSASMKHFNDYYKYLILMYKRCGECRIVYTPDGEIDIKVYGPFDDSYRKVCEYLKTGEYIFDDEVSKEISLGTLDFLSRQKVYLTKMEQPYERKICSAN